jgi:hypothetical protein
LPSTRWVSTRLIWMRRRCRRARTCMCGTVIARFTFCKLRCHYFKIAVVLLRYNIWAK